MGIKEYIESKKEFAKKTLVGGVALATLLGGAVGLTSCDESGKDPKDTTYAQTGASDTYTQETNYLDEEYFAMIVSSQGNINKYVLSILFNPQMDNVSYALTKKQFDFIMENSRDFADGNNIAYAEGAGVVFANKDAIDIEGLESVKKYINNIIKTQESYYEPPTVETYTYKDHSLETSRVVESGDDYVIYEMK